MVEVEVNEKAAQFARLKAGLLTVDEQIRLLESYNHLYWDGFFTLRQLRSFSFSSSRKQELEDLEVLHVEFTSPAETAAMWWRVFAGEYGRHYLSDRISLDTEHLSLLGSGVRQYEPGIHSVRINLLANWQPRHEPWRSDGRRPLDLDEIRSLAIAQGQTLAHAEVLSAYALHPELLREGSRGVWPWGTWLPGFASKPVTTLSQPRPCSLYLEWDSNSRHVRLHTHECEHRLEWRAAPLILSE